MIQLLRITLVAAIAGSINDRYGRKAALMSSAIFFLVSAIGTALPQDVYQLIAFRLLGGVGVGIAAVVSPMYIADMTPEKIRGRLVSLNQIAIQPGDAVVGECSIGCRRCKRCLSGNYHLCADRSESGLLKQRGGMAEFISYPRHFLHKVDGLSFEQAAFIEPTGIAVNPARKTRITPADRVAVIGPGPIGLFAVQVARAYGAKQVLLVGGSDSRLQAGLDLGADAVVDYRKGDVGPQVRNLTNGDMVDVVIEAVGRKSVWPMIASIVAPGARVAMTGLFAGEICDVNFDPLVVQEVSVLGCLGAPGMWPECISLHRRGLVRTERIITHRLALAEFSEAVEISRTRRDGAIKVVLTP